MKLAEAQYQLSQTDTGYKFTQHTGLHGIARLIRSDSLSATSLIDQVDDQLLLKRHTYSQTGQENHINEDFTIQWDSSAVPPKGRISGMVRNKKAKLVTDKPVWDVLSFQIPLMLDAKPEKKDYRYSAIIEGKLDTYNFVQKSQKTISFAGKAYLALQMVRTHPTKNRELHVWLAPELQNMPLLIENYRNGKIHVRAQLEKLQFHNEQPLDDIIKDRPVD
jgi:hypothetical protein